MAITHTIQSAAIRPLREQHDALSSTLDAQSKERIAKRITVFKKRKGPLFIGSVSRNDRIFFIDNLATMLNAGLSITLALATLASEAKKKIMKRALVSIQHEIANGGLFSQGLRDHPEIFSPLFISVVQVGEVGGTLNEVLARLAAVAKKEKALRTKIVSALIYPGIVVSAMIIIIIVLMLYVFPQLISIFEDVNIELPLQTKVLISTVRFMQAYGLYVLAVFLLLIAALIFARRLRQIRHMFDWVFLRLPFMGRVARELSLTRIFGNLKMLLTSGVPIVQSFTISSRTAGNLVYEKAMQEVARQLELGKSVHEMLAQDPNLFPTLVVTMSRVGEETGKLDEIMGKLEMFYETRVENVFANLSTIIEPVLLLCIGVMVGFIAVSIILPIYNLAQAF